MEGRKNTRKNTKKAHEAPEGVTATSMAFLVLFSVGVSGCELTALEETALHDAFSPEVSASPETQPMIPVPAAPSCTEETFTQPDAIVSKSIDLLFVVDTSGSLREERGRVAEGLDAFVSELPAHGDYRIAVMLAHGSRSRYSGRLFANRNRPLVLDSSKLSLSEIKAELRYTMLYPASDYYSDGGEEGLYGLSRALDPDRLAESRAAGFFREDAALAVVFITDENDICAQYPAGVKPVFDYDKLEGPAHARDCSGISEAGVFAKLQAHQGVRPYVLGGVLYNNAATMPRRGENELGYGYLELIRRAGGVSVDIGGSHYTEGLARIGSLVTVKLDLQRQLVLTRDRIDAATLEAYVDGLPVAFTYDSERRIVDLIDPGRARSEVRVRYCLLSEPSGDENGAENPAGVGDSGDAGGAEDGNTENSGQSECTALTCGGGILGV